MVESSESYKILSNYTIKIINLVYQHVVHMR